MDELPPEILQRIFIHLDFVQRLVCLRVCRRWWIVLDKHILFYSINIEKEDDRFTNIMNIFEQSPDSAAQVKELEIALTTDTHFNRRALYNIFPNVTVIRLKPDVRSKQSITSHFRQDMDLTHSKTRIEHLSDFLHFELLSQLVYSNLGGRLRTLHLMFYSKSDTQNTISLLKHLPVLKKLSLFAPYININDLERLHENTPSLVELILRATHIRNGDMPSNIIPAASIKTLEYIGGSCSRKETLIPFYQYITKKYAKITSSRFKDFTLLIRSPSAPDKKEIYLNGLVDLYRLIGPRQSELVFYGLPEDVNPFETLDSVDSRIKALSFHGCEDRTIYQHFAQSNQCKYIEKIEIQNRIHHPIHYFKNMRTLTELSLDITVKLSLSECLDACPPSLKHLTIKSTNLIVEPYANHLDSIETLSIGDKPTYNQLSDNPAPNHLGDIISSCFPNMAKLTLVNDRSESLAITLNNPNFQSATFYEGLTPYSKDGFGFSLKTPNQTQYFLHRKGKNRLVSYEMIRNLPILSVVSLTDKRLDFNNNGPIITLLPC